MLGALLCLLAAAPAPPPFAPARAPLRPDQEPDAGAFVNRERVYDFYGKQALEFGPGRSTPPLIPAFPGLDGGAHGHQGNQNDAVTWRDGRWGASDFGNLFSGVLRGAGLVLPKAVWVREGERCAAFDPISLSFPIEWKAPFVRLGDMRHGFNLGAEPAGTLVRATPAAARTGAYRGFYVHGDKVIFSYEREGKAWLATLGDGERPHAELAHLTRGGPARWPGWITTSGRLGKGGPVAVDTAVIPFDNPHGTLFFLSGLDFLPDGTGVVATMTGEVWLVRGLEGDLREIRWKRFATGLHQPLGVKVVGGRVHVLGRDQVTRLDDLNGDDEADFHACVAAAIPTSPGGHDFVIGLETDAQGRFLTASGNKGLLRLAPGGAVEVLATGLRNPNGIGLSVDGRFLTSSLQEGNWTPASAIAQVDLAAASTPHFGDGGRGRQGISLPLLHLPRGEDNSSAGQVHLGAGRWPTLAGEGNLVHLSFGTGTAWMVTRQKVGDTWQGAAQRLTGSMESGAQHGRFHPVDGSLWVSGLRGWQTYTTQDGCLHRLRPTGGAPVLVGHEVRGNGVLLRFDRALPARAARREAHFAQCWNYRAPSPAYGSPELSLRHPGVAGHDPLEVRSATLSDGGRTLFLELPTLRPCHQLHLRVPSHGELGLDLFLTVHRLGEDFADFPGYVRHDPSDHAAAPASEGTKAAARPVRWEEDLCAPGARELRVEAATGLRFFPTELRAKPGEPVRLTFSNPDSMPHNWVLTDLGAARRVGEAANHLATQVDALERHYAPDLPEVLCHTRVVNPGESTTIAFVAPRVPGRYPFLCTIPGHWQLMRGELVVE